MQLQEFTKCNHALMWSFVYDSVYRRSLWQWLSFIEDDLGLPVATHGSTPGYWMDQFSKGKPYDIGRAFDLIEHARCAELIVRDRWAPHRNQSTTAWASTGFEARESQCGSDPRGYHWRAGPKRPWFMATIVEHGYQAIKSMVDPTPEEVEQFKYSAALSQARWDGNGLGGKYRRAIEEYDEHELHCAIWWAHDQAEDDGLADDDGCVEFDEIARLVMKRGFVIDRDDLLAARDKMFWMHWMKPKPYMVDGRPWLSKCEHRAPMRPKKKRGLSSRRKRGVKSERAEADPCPERREVQGNVND